ncbi:MAG: diacylglycerol kinase family protein [Actinomycetaceae bacterium]|nr:NAD(+)/NADH kinase [Arcanobacterium sp.]MDD7505090.1 diacylglycerol kinase family protein [Actinomycetaceae bacterium]MDY6142607.1 diacylglycerol kinase family protein [Arcanobacterium sp.]
MTWTLFLAVLALVLSVVVLVMLLTQRKLLRATIRSVKELAKQHGSHAAVPMSSTAQNAAYVVYNPSKNIDWDYLKDVVQSTAIEASLPEPVWLATTVEDPGGGQARQAIEAGASVVIAVGGDGTIRTVAQELAGSDVPLGILPAGTGNLLARNLQLPLDSMRDAVITALTGREKRLDVGWLIIDESLVADDLTDRERHALEKNARKSRKYREADPDSLQPVARGRYAYTVIGGVGFDADIMNSADSSLKSKFGWIAYVGAAIPHMFTSKISARITLGKSDEAIVAQLRSVMFLNCAELPGGFSLDRRADPSDGWLELAALDVRGGLIGWADLARRVGLETAGFKASLPTIESLSGEVRTHRVQECRVEFDMPQQVEVDGDVLGYARSVRTEVQHGALRVRVRV